MTKTIGRFEIVRLLGRGAQSAVYLAYDPHLERDVAIKTLHFARRDRVQNQLLLQEARTVSKLRHASIVPIFEAGEQDGDPYLVFEYVEGQTLAQIIAERGALPVAQALEIALAMLDAVSYAHRFGTIHRDLKPSNILINGEGVPRVMDFGIAARVQGEGGSRIAQNLSGTPAYMAPEYVTERIVSPQSDIFAAGLVLYEMVFGRRAVQATDARQALQQVASEPIGFPAEERIDEALHAIIAKATARDPQLRYATAAQMKEAIEAYRSPPPAEVAPGAEEQKATGTLEFLLRRMRHKSDFPALSEAISAINRLANSEKENVNTLSNAILKDFALTNKILRLVNSAYYRTAGGGSISTVSRAIVVLGFNAIRNIAISLILFEHLQDKQHAQALKEEFLRANLSGMLGKDLAQRVLPRDGEETYICALFHNLGRLLTQYYFPEEAQAIERTREQQGCSEEAAASRVLGTGYQDLGIGVARSWGFPESIVHSMRRLPPGEVKAPNTREERMRVIAGLSNELASIIQNQTPESRPAELARLKARFAEAVPLTEKQLAAVLEASVQEIAEFARIVRVNLRSTNIGRQILAVPGGQEDRPVRDAEDASVPGALGDTLVAGEPDEAASGREEARGPEPSAAPADAQSVLTAGIQDISNSLVEDFSLNDLLRIILETMYRAMGFRRVIMCVRDARGNVMNGRFGFGPDVEESARRFRFPLGGKDIFNVILTKGVDVLISDATEPTIAERIPEWFRKGFAAQTFIVFPLIIKGNPVAMIYADRPRAGEIVISDKELSLLRTLRNQAVLAIKQSA